MTEDRADSIVRCVICESCGKPMPWLIIGLTAYPETVGVCRSCVDYGHVHIEDRHLYREGTDHG